MGNSTKIDFAKLVGFATVGDRFSGCVDFADDTVSAKLGAKVGDAVEPSSPSEKVNFAKLLGFETISDQLADGLDLKNGTVSDKLGAKIGPVETDEASK